MLDCEYNCVMLSEYEQNLIKETTESPVPGRRRKWSLFKQGGGLSKSPENRAAHHQSPARKPMIGVGGFRQVSYIARCQRLPTNLATYVFLKSVPLLPNYFPFRLASLLLTTTRLLWPCHQVVDLATLGVPEEEEDGRDLASQQGCYSTLLWALL